MNTAAAAPAHSNGRRQPTFIVAPLSGVVIVQGFNGRSELRGALSRELISGTPDMTASAIRAEARQAGLDLAATPIPSCSVAGQKIDTGDKAKCFASYMRVHALEATGGQVFSQMGRYLDKGGKATSDLTKAAVDPTTGKPVTSGARDVWIQLNALATGLNMSYLVEQIGGHQAPSLASPRWVFRARGASGARTVPHAGPRSARARGSPRGDARSRAHRFGSARRATACGKHTDGASQRAERAPRGRRRRAMR